jgi:hypothetical protein
VGLPRLSRISRAAMSMMAVISAPCLAEAPPCAAPRETRRCLRYRCAWRKRQTKARELLSQSLGKWTTLLPLQKKCMALLLNMVT